MISKKVRCPKCKHIITLEGVPGETVRQPCPECNNTAIFEFSNQQPIIEIKNLTKRYEKETAVNNVSFSVKKGEIFGFLGPNGAGKTTTIKAILDLIKTDSGDIIIEGFDIKKQGKKAKQHIGYLPEKVAFYNNLTALQNLKFYAEMKKTPKEQCKTLIEEFGLGDSVNKKVGKYSKGMTQRLGMARAILGNPSIIILDEPSGGLDPRGVLQIREKIKELKNQGATIFISSHILSEIQEVCDRVGIINNGVLVAKDTVTGLSNKLNIKPKMIMELENIPPKLEEKIKKVKGVDNVEIIGKMVHVVCDQTTKSKVIIAIEKANASILNFYTQEPSLEQVFMRYTGG